MSNQLYWEDIIEKSEMPPLAKVATTQMLVQFAGASGDFNPLHYQDSFAVAQGVERPIIHGQLKRAWLVQFVTGWMGDEGTLKKFSCSFRGVDYARRMKTRWEPEDGETWQCKGTITKKSVEGDEHRVDCEIWLENGKGEKTTTGNATVILPHR
ncbi:MAG: MaoC/PaaZ C-terminal domain-containing protein [Dehalococcoidales bacterium]|nr:MaoC/PaaZ C-terminal domain-containing protein [Dehalococcoidales bacterium]